MRNMAAKMRNARWLGILVLVGVLGSSSGEELWAQVAQERLGAMKERLQQVKVIAERLPEQKRRLLGSVQNLIHLAEKWDQIEPILLRAAEGFGVGVLGPKILAPAHVSDPSTDVLFSSFVGFTQSETSVGWCGHNVVVGFNDSGSVFEQLPVSPTLSFSLNGFARSTNKGHSFTDQGFLPSDPVPQNSFSYWLLGDPVVQCTDPYTFYYASLALNISAIGFLSEISVSRSTDGGASFGGPIRAASKPFATHNLDKPWMAVDPTDHNRLYVTYTDFDASGISMACSMVFRTAIELVCSTDGGMTWSDPVVIAEICGNAFVQGSQVVVGPYGRVYVAWEAVAADFVTRERIYGHPTITVNPSGLL